MIKIGDEIFIESGSTTFGNYHATVTKIEKVATYPTYYECVDKDGISHCVSERQVVKQNSKKPIIFLLLIIGIGFVFLK